MEKKNGDFLQVTTHQFKNNISRYLRELEKEEYRAIMLMCKDRIVGVLHSYEALSKNSSERKKSGPTGPTGKKWS